MKQLGYETAQSRARRHRPSGSGEAPQLLTASVVTALLSQLWAGKLSLLWKLKMCSVEEEVKLVYVEKSACPWSLIGPLYANMDSKCAV